MPNKKPIWAILPTNMGHITNQYGPYYQPTPAPPQGRGAPKDSLISHICPISPISLISHISLPPFGGIVGGYQYGPYYQPTPCPSPREGAERLSHRAYKSHKPHKYNNCSRGNEVRDWTHQKQKRDPKVSFCGAYGTRNREALSEQSGERTLTSRGNEVRDWTHQKQKRDPKVSFCGAYGTRTRDLLRDRQAF